MSRRGSVLIEAIIALLVFMVGTAALASLMHGSLAALARAELEGRLAPEVAGIPLRAAEAPEGALERPDGLLRWRPAEEDPDREPEALPEIEIEFVREATGAADLRWRLPVRPGLP